MFAICTFLITFFRETQYSSLDDKNFVLTLSSVEHHRTVSFQEASLIPNWLINRRVNNFKTRSLFCVYIGNELWFN